MPEVNRLHHDLVNVRGAHEAIRSKTQQIAERVRRLSEESAQTDGDIARDEAEAEGCRSRLEISAGTAIVAVSNAAPGSSTSATRCATELRQRASGMPEHMHAAQQVAIRVESQRSTLATLRTSLERANEQSRQLRSPPC